mgnify:CR=1 FL=1
MNLEKREKNMIPKPTEDTITNLLAKELEKFGVKVETFPAIDTPNGIRKPDILCINAGTYLLEAKFRERDLIDAIAKVQNDYIRWYDVLGIKGGFALLYPEKLAERLPPDIVAALAYKVKFKVIALFPPKDTRKSFTVYEGTFQEIAKILAEHILTPPDYVEPSTDYIIKALRDSAMYITATLKYLSGKELEDIFGGKEVFKNILQYEERKYPLESLKLASAYLLINQLLFYHVLSKRMPDKFPEIDADRIERPADLNNYFKNVLNVNYRTIFSYDVASRIPSGFRDQIKAVINVIKGLAPEKVGGDLLGTIFHDLVPFEVRKNAAAFYTNVLAAELLAWLSIDKHDAKVADFAVGSGGLLVAAYRRKRHLLESERTFTAEDHRRFVEEELLGIDVMPFAANVAACHLALQSPEYFTNRVNVAIWDSTELEPGQRIPSIASLKFVLKGQAGLDMFIESKAEAKGVVSLTGEIPKEIKLEKYDVVMMNPPFTRQERIPQEYKAILCDRFKDYKKYFHGQLGYFGYFILLADKFLKNNGRMALVLPATVLRIESCEGIRKLWAEHYHVEHIITTWHRSAFSESVRFREILLVAKKGQPVKNAKTVVTVLKKLPRKPSEARKTAELISKTKGDYQDDRVAVKIYEYVRFRNDTKNWFKWISVSDLSLLDLMEELLSSEKLVPLSSIAEAQECDLRHYKFKDFHGFILHDAFRASKRTDLWVADEIENNECLAKHIKLGWKVCVPLKVLGRGLRRLSYVNTMDVTDTADYLILSWFDKVKDLARPLLTVRELKQFNSKVIDGWKNKFNDRKCHVVLGRRFDISAPGTSLIAFYSSNPIIGVDFWSIKNVQGEYGKVLTLWLNSTINLLQTFILRTETRGAWMKIHDYMLKELLVPKQDKLDKTDHSKLINVFEQVKSVEFPSILKQLKGKHPLRRLIDETWLNVLGYRGDATQLLDKLYESLAQEIIILKKMMAEKIE